MKKRLCFLLLLFVLITESVLAGDAKTELERLLKEADTMMEEKEPVVWRYLLGGSFGMNYLLNGYDEYKKNYPDFGVDFRFIPEKDTGSTRYSYRISLEYFPLVVPEGTYGLKEDIYALSGGIVVNFYRHKNFDSYIGFAPGFYCDYIKLSTPVSGDISGRYNYFGFNMSLGITFKTQYNILFGPEIKMHALLGQKHIATHMSLQFGILYYL